LRGHYGPGRVRLTDGSLLFYRISASTALPGKTCSGKSHRE